MYGWMLQEWALWEIRIPRQRYITFYVVCEREMGNDIIIWDFEILVLVLVSSKQRILTQK